MKLLNKIIAVAVLCVTASGLNAQTESPFFISFDFDSDRAATVIDPASAFASVGDFMGGDLSGSALNGDLVSGSPVSFSFDFEVASGFFASIYAVGYSASYVGQIATVTAVLNEGLVLGGDGIMGNSSKDVSFFTPTLTDLTGTNTLTFEALGFDGTVALEDFHIFGVVSAVPETSTILLSGVAGLAAFAMMRRRRREAARTA